MMIEKSKGLKTLYTALLLLCMITVAVTFTAEPAFAGSKAFKKTAVKGVKAVSVDYRTVKVSWKQKKGAGGYVVYAAKSKLARYHEVATVKASKGSSVEIGKCVTNKTYYFKVAAYQVVGGRKVLSKKSAAKPGKAVMAKPKVALMAIGGKKMKVSFKKINGAKQYKIFRASKKKGKYQLVKTLNADPKDKTVDWYDTKGVKPGAKYFYKVQAIRTKKISSDLSAVAFLKMPSKDGNAAQYDVSRVAAYSGSPASYAALQNKRIIFLGSSVTRGKYSDDQSFVDILTKKYGLQAVKSAVNGTTLVDSGSESYIKRLQAISSVRGVKPDLLICQLSSNDARKRSAIGSAAGPREGSGAWKTAYNTQTVTGAIEYVASYAEQTLGCPVVFYVLPRFSSTYFHDDHYLKMRSALYSAQSRWEAAEGHQGQMLILDLWNDSSFSYASADDREFYMVDSVHPTKAGYLQKFTPAFEKYLSVLLQPKPETDQEPIPDKDEGEGVEMTSQDLDEGSAAASDDSDVYAVSVGYGDAGVSGETVEED